MPRSGVGVELEAVDVGGSLGCYIFDMDETLARYHCTEVYKVIAVAGGGRRCCLPHASATPLARIWLAAWLQARAAIDH